MAFPTLVVNLPRFVTFVEGSFAMRNSPTPQTAVREKRLKAAVLRSPVFRFFFFATET